MLKMNMKGGMRVNIQQFYNGDVFDAYRYFGAHPVKGGGVMFRTFALNAMSVSILGEFSNWADVPMSDAARTGFYEVLTAGWSTAIPTASGWSSGRISRRSSGISMLTASRMKSG